MTDNENALVVSPVLHHAPTLFTPTTRAAQRVLEFFTAQINNDHTRKASKPFDIAINFRPPISAHEIVDSRVFQRGFSQGQNESVVGFQNRHEARIMVFHCGHPSSIIRAGKAD